MKIILLTLALLTLSSCLPTKTAPTPTPPAPVVIILPPVVVPPSPVVPVEKPKLKLVLSGVFLNVFSESFVAQPGLRIRLHGTNLYGYDGICQRKLFVLTDSGFLETTKTNQAFVFENDNYVSAPNGTYQQFDTLTCPLPSLGSYEALNLGKVFGTVTRAEVLFSGEVFPLNF